MNVIHQHQNEKVIFYDIFTRFEDNNIKLLNYIFYIFIVMFGFTFKYEGNNDLVSNDNFFYVFIGHIFVIELE